MGIKRRLKLLATKIGFSFLQNVFLRIAIEVCKSLIKPKNNDQYGYQKTQNFWQTLNEMSQKNGAFSRILPFIHSYCNSKTYKIEVPIVPTAQAGPVEFV
jgi:hypothetical protein